ncbi:MAG: response regulator [Deltaproteobacteria bacterium]|nr:MAG: response regulator [Deltaproteobacteria bacterium]
MQQPATILVCDDEEMNRCLLKDALQYQGYNVIEATDGLDALEKLILEPDLVILDVLMPGLTGFEVAAQIKDEPRTEHIPILMITALNGRQHKIKAIESGADDLLNKPFDLVELGVRVRSLLKVKFYHDQLKAQNKSLEWHVAERTKQLNEAMKRLDQANRKLKEANLETIYRLSVAAEYRDADTAAHIMRMSAYSAMLARKIQLPTETVEMILCASPMHDVGKIGVPDHILLKPDKLTTEEFLLMQKHAEFGAEILRGSESPLLQMAAEIALGHHERYDGRGYPRGVAGEEIPLSARIVALADVFDALTSARCYKRAFSNEVAKRIIREERGRHFDPDLVEAFLDCDEEIRLIQKKYSDEANPDIHHNWRQMIEAQRALEQPEESGEAEQGRLLDRLLPPPLAATAT